MPVYSVSQLEALRESELVTRPDFKWHEFEKELQPQARQKRGVPPAIQLAPAKAAQPQTFSDEAFEDEDEKLAAHFFLQREQRPQAKAVTAGVPVKYAASLSASKDGASTGSTKPAVAAAPVAENNGSAIADDEDEDDGWTSVSRDVKPRRKSSGRRAGSFTRWR